jgi:hypothetical protein
MTFPNTVKLVQSGITRDRIHFPHYTSLKSYYMLHNCLWDSRCSRFRAVVCGYMVMTPNKVRCITGKFPRQRLDIAAMFSLASSKLSATWLSPNLASAKHFLTVCALIYFAANLVQFTASRTEQILLMRMRKSYRLLIHSKSKIVVWFECVNNIHIHGL